MMLYSLKDQQKIIQRFRVNIMSINGWIDPLFKKPRVFVRMKTIMLGQSEPNRCDETLNCAIETEVNSMTKDEFIIQLSKKMNCSLAEAEERLSAMVEAIQAIWKTDRELTLPGFGKFSVAKRAARMGYDPHRKRPTPVAAKAIPIFKAGQALCLHINNLLKKD